MIFISHTKSDKALVEPVAIRLAQVFGKENIFYDSWSIQPGEGIIDKMNDALSKSRFFFFFVSKNSLNSNMVKLEWQNALYKQTRNQITLIPVKIMSYTNIMNHFDTFCFQSKNIQGYFTGYFCSTQILTHFFILFVGKLPNLITIYLNLFLYNK